jgi:hypothetical protein
MAFLRFPESAALYPEQYLQPRPVSASTVQVLLQHDNPNFWCVVDSDFNAIHQLAHTFPTFQQKPGDVIDQQVINRVDFAHAGEIKIRCPTW